MDIEILIGNCNGRESHILHEIANWKLLRFHFVRYDFDSCQPTVMKMFFFWIEFIAVSHRFSSFARFFAWFSTANTLRNLPIRYLCEIAICKVHVFQFCKSIIGGHQMNGLFLFSFNFTKKNAHWKELKRSWLRMDSLFVVCLFVRSYQQGSIPTLLFALIDAGPKQLPFFAFFASRILKVRTKRIKQYYCMRALFLSSGPV